MANANGSLPHAFYIYKSIVLFIIFSNICVFFLRTKKNNKFLHNFYNFYTNIDIIMN